MDKIIHIDINCDVGEGIGNEKELLPLISSCNIACGGHAGDEDSMRQTVQLAKEHQVLIGAHPSYPDRENFGRLSMDIDSRKLVESIQLQMWDLTAILTDEQVEMHHIKPHGALYNDLAKDKTLPLVFLKAIQEFKHSVVLYAPHGSVLAQEALKQEFKLKYEAFADRNYNRDLSLVSRKSPNAVLKNPKEVLNHLVNMVREQQVRTLGGPKCPIVADTYCLHGDTPNALRILTYLSKKLPEYNIHIKK